MIELRRIIEKEGHSLEEMIKGNAKIPRGWSIEKQKGFVSGLLYAKKVIQNPEIFKE